MKHTAVRSNSPEVIDAALRRIAERVIGTNPRVTVTESAPRSQSTINNLVLRTPERAQIKMEVTPVLRGCVYPPHALLSNACRDITRDSTHNFQGMADEGLAWRTCAGYCREYT